MNLMKTLVYKNLKLNKKRSLVTIVGIILATALLSALVTLVSSFQYSMIQYEKQKNGDYHYAFSGVTREDLPEFENNRAIESMFEISQVGYARIQGCKNEDKPYAYVVETDKTGFEKAGFDLIEGRMAENADEIVIPRHLKTNGRVDYKVGDEIRLYVAQRWDKTEKKTLTQSTPYLGDKEKLINLKSHKYKVVGIMERPGYGMEDYSASGYTCVTYSQDPTDNMTVYVRYTAKGLRNQYAVTAGILGVDESLFTKVNNIDEMTDFSEEDMTRYDDQMEKAKYGMYANGGLIRYERIYPLDGSFKTMYIMAMFVALIIILTSVYCIKNSFQISITEKIRQYGMLSSVGATRRQIRKSVKLEAAMLGVVGVPVGMGSGLLAAYILTRVVNLLLQDALSIEMVCHTSVIMLALALLLSILTIYFSALGSARRAAKVTPLEAIRNTHEIKMKPGKLKTPRYISRFWGIGGVISYKNIKRNRRKYRTTVISIVICSITFIVISYFMSLAFHLVRMSYGNQSYNVSVWADGDAKVSNEKMAGIIREIDGVKEFVVAKEYYFNVDHPELTGDFREYEQQMYADGEEQSSDMTFKLIVMEQKGFDSYVRQMGLSDVGTGAILINRGTLEFYDEKSGKYTQRETRLFDYKAGDKLKLQYYVGSTEDEDSSDTETLNDEADAGERKELGITLAGTVDQAPLGYMDSSFSMPTLIVDQSGFDALWKGRTYDYQNSVRQQAYMDAKDADTCQDTLEKTLSGVFVDDANYTVYNRDREMQQEKSLFILIGIFAYGLIVVIALIGITNIINTLGTSMELRSREFATLRSIGMTDRQFARMVRLESLFLSAKSLVIGLPVGLILTYVICLMENKMDSVVIYQPPIFAMLICAVVVILLIYGIMKVSMAKIGRGNIIETIKNENL